MKLAASCQLLARGLQHGQAVAGTCCSIFLAQQACCGDQKMPKKCSRHLLPTCLLGVGHSKHDCQWGGRTQAGRDGSAHLVCTPYWPPRLGPPILCSSVANPSHCFWNEKKWSGVYFNASGMLIPLSHFSNSSADKGEVTLRSAAQQVPKRTQLHSLKP